MVFLRSIAWIFAIRCNILKLQHYHSTFENQKYVHVFLLSLSVRVAKWVGFDRPGCLIRILAGWIGVFQSSTHFGLSTQRAGRLMAGPPTHQKRGQPAFANPSAHQPTLKQARCIFRLTFLGEQARAGQPIFLWTEAGRLVSILVYKK